ncbi:hypothetical protein, partial [Anaplasma marginale]
SLDVSERANAARELIAAEKIRKWARDINNLDADERAMVAGALTLAQQCDSSQPHTLSVCRKVMCGSHGTCDSGVFWAHSIAGVMWASGMVAPDMLHALSMVS